MRRTTSLVLSTGQKVQVELDSEDSDLVRARTPGEVVAMATESLSDILAPIRDAADEVIRTLRTAAARPDRIDVQFGVRLTAEANAVIAKAATEGQILVTLGWERGQDAAA
jgi:hypothetical protein